MGKYIVTLRPEEEKALLGFTTSIQELLDNFAHTRARQAMDKIVEEHSDKQHKKLHMPEKAAIVMAAKFETAQERKDRIEEEARVGLGS